MLSLLHGPPLVLCPSGPLFPSVGRGVTPADSQSLPVLLVCVLHCVALKVLPRDLIFSRG